MNDFRIDKNKIPSKTGNGQVNFIIIIIKKKTMEKGQDGMTMFLFVSMSDEQEIKSVHS